jgi:hypothetical protein
MHFAHTINISGMAVAAANGLSPELLSAVVERAPLEGKRSNRGKRAGLLPAAARMTLAKTGPIAAHVRLIGAKRPPKPAQAVTKPFK